MQSQETHLVLRRHRRFKKLAFAATAAAASFAGVQRATAAAGASHTYVWNSSGTDWGTGTDWNPTGPPTATDAAAFLPTPIYATPTNANIAGPQSVLALGIGNNAALGNYTFTGNNTLTINGFLSTRGTGSTVFNGPSIAGTGTFSIGYDSGLVLQGTSVATNSGALSIYGTLTLDNTAYPAASRTATTGAALININGGTLSVLGSTAGGQISAGSLNVGNTAPSAGLITISVSVPAGAAAGTAITFGNTTTFDLRTTTFMGYDFVGVGGTLGSSGGPLITFMHAPLMNTAGTLAVSGEFVNTNSASSNTVGFAIATDSSGVGFATYVTPNISANTGGVEILASTPVSTATQFNALTGTSYGNLTVAGSTTTTVGSTEVLIGSLQLSPSGSGAVLDLATNNTSIKTNAILLGGANDFTISGSSTSTLDGTAAKNIWVANPSTTLNIGAVLDGSGSAGSDIDLQGPGFVVLTGAYPQLTLTSGNRLNMINGTIRGNATQLGGFGASGGSGIFCFRGGVLEITGGSDGTGASADFMRPVGQGTGGAGTVNWSSSATQDSQGGSGGFSAYGSAASVNLGGNATPTTLTWVTTNGFVQDGEALIFGSTKSNARLDFLNNIALDSGTAGAFNAREIKVIGNATPGSGDSTNIQGVISGSSSTDLLKSGSGTLTLSGANTYAGDTLVTAGTLTIDNTNNASASLAGTTTVNVGTGATLSLVSSVANAGGGTTTLINDNAAIAVSGTGKVVLNLQGSTENVKYFIVNGVIQPAGVYSQTMEPGTASGDETYFTNAGNSLDSITVAAPEPGSLSLLVLGGVGLLRRRRRFAD